MSKLYFQGDVCLELVDDVEVSGDKIEPDYDDAIVLARGEEHGHRHAFYNNPYGGAVMFRDDALARDIPDDLYIGHVKLAKPEKLEHEEHATIELPAGTYRVRQQRRATITIDPKSAEVRREVRRAID